MFFPVTKRMAPQRCLVLWLISALISVGFVYFTSTLYLKAQRRYSLEPFASYFSTSSTPKSLAQTLPELWASSIHDIHDDTFTTDGGESHTIPAGSHRWGKLGGKVLIIDVDTRPGLERGPITERQAGYMNHLLYSLIHGYDYRLIQAPDYPDRHGTWVKVPFVREALKSYEIVVFLDNDAIFRHQQLPLEWVMSYWNITKDSLIAMAGDPDSEHNQDQFGRVLQNTGFLVAQQSERTQEMFADWEDCPTGKLKKHAECVRWAYDWAHEQAAFGNYIRYDYDRADDIRWIEYMDANGPDGWFVKHDWFKKNAPIDSLYEKYSDDFISQLERYFRNEKKLHIDASDHAYPLNNCRIL